MSEPKPLTRPEEERAALLERAVRRVLEAEREALKVDIREAVSAVFQELDRSDRKDAFKNALKEMMRDQLARFGGWALGAIGAAVVIAAVGTLLYVAFLKAGWTPPK